MPLINDILGNRLYLRSSLIHLLDMKAKCIFLLLIFVLIGHTSKSQVLISLLLGDKLNTGKIEFGLEGGFNYSNFHNLEESKSRPNFNLGFYFLLKVSDQSYLNTGVLVKATQGARGLDTYPIGDALADSLFVDGSLDRRINYFQVPINYHFRTNFGLFLEGGLQVALRNGGQDYFLEDVLEKEDAALRVSTKSNYTTLDAGLLGGLGYKLKDREGGIPGMSFGTKYYYGLVDVSRDANEELFNDSFYFYVRIPIGAGKAQDNNSAE